MKSKQNTEKHLANDIYLTYCHLFYGIRSVDAPVYEKLWSVACNERTGKKCEYFFICIVTTVNAFAFLYVLLVLSKND